MNENIEGLAFCTCPDQDCLPSIEWLTDVNRKSVEVLICPTCGGQIKTEKEEI